MGQRKGRHHRQRNGNGRYNTLEGPQKTITMTLDEYEAGKLNISSALGKVHCTKKEYKEALRILYHLPVKEFSEEQFDEALKTFGYDL